MDFWYQKPTKDPVSATTAVPERKRGAPTAAAPGTTLVKPVSNALAILRLLTAATTPMSLSQIAAALGLNVSTCLYILRTLVHERVLRVDAASRGYVLDVGLFDLLQGALAQGGQIHAVRPKMEKVAREFGITVTVWRVEGDRLALAAVGESDAAMRIQMEIGQRVPLLVGAMGRLVAAHSGRSEAELRRLFREVRWQNPLTFESFLSQARKARRTGWAIDDGQVSSGTVTVSAPVFDRNGSFNMACSGTMFKGQHDSDRVKKVAEQLLVIARILTPEAVNA
jgi:DNA-binding IclR family transcriptional regulator